MSVPAPGAPLGPGSVLASRYDIRRVLGRGGMGMVYEAHDRLLDERVAIKVLRPDVATSSELEQRFRAEIKIARAVSHRNVCRIHEYGEDGDLRFISMAYVDGTDLKAVLRAKGALPAAEAFDVLVPVAEALAAIHDEGIVHRDLKTPNIMIDSRGVVRVMDFGIAKQSGAEGLDMTATGQIVGTPEYMSPEQVHGRGLDGRSDLYSLGVVAFELFTGRTPFRAETPLATVLLHLNEPPPLDGPPAEKLPPAMVPVLRRALAKARDDRYADAREMTRALVDARSRSLPATDRFAKTVEAPGSGERETDVLTLATPAGASSTVTQTNDTAGPTSAGRDGAAEGTAPGAGSATAGAGEPGRVWIGIGIAAALAVVAGGLWLVLRPGPSLPPAPTPVPSAAMAALPSPAPAGEAARPSAPALESPTASPLVARGPAPRRPPTSSPAPGTPTPSAPAASAAVTGSPATARPAVEEQIDRFLAQADAALEAQDFAAAIARYDDVLRLDPRNAVARMGKTGAITARATRSAPARPAPPAKSFQAGKTEAESAETAPDTALASGFEPAPGMAVTRDTQAAALPGRIEFRTEPESVRPGERFRLEALFVNPGGGPIEIRQMTVRTTVNGRNAGGPVPALAKTIAPGQQATILSVSDSLREDLASWSLEVVVTTARGETYRNRIVWMSPAPSGR